MSRKNRNEKPTPKWRGEDRRIQAYVPTKEMKDDFDNIAHDLGMTESRFVVHLFMLYKRGALKLRDESRGLV